MPEIKINENECKGCGLCILACPKKIIELSKDHVNSKGHYPAVCREMNKCIGCAMCATMCPDVCIAVYR